MRPHSLREALTPVLSYPEARIVWALRAALAAMAAYAALVPRLEYTTKPLLAASALSGLAASVGFAFVRTTRPRTLSAAEAITLAAVGMHVGGHAFGWYAAFPWYDTALHFVVPLVTVLVLYALSQATEWVWDWTKVTPFEVGLYLFTMTVTIGVMWEILEFATDQLAGTKEQDNLVDTMVDLLADVAGGLLGAALAGWATSVGRKKGFGRIAEEPKPADVRADAREA